MSDELSLSISKEDLIWASQQKLIEEEKVAKLWDALIDHEKNKLTQKNSAYSNFILPAKAFVTVKNEDGTTSLQIDKKACEKLTPLLVFVNNKSGGQQGKEVFVKLRTLLSPNQVFDLIADKGPERGLQLFKDVPNTRVLICGGDGTIGWYLNTIDALHFQNQPPAAILPLGTGNDLARALGWGPGYDGESLTKILTKVSQSKEVLLDRWAVDITLDKKDSNAPTGPPGAMNNYFSIGLDANIALEFHKEREAHPEKFDSRLGNKFQYFILGNKSLFEKSPKLDEIVELECDGQVVAVPHSAESLIFLNISSFMGGSNPWGQAGSNKKWKPQRVDDKLIEVVSVSGTTELAMIKTGLLHGKRLAQASQIKVSLKRSISVQKDGEPWIQEPCSIRVTLAEQEKMLVSE